MSLLPYIYFNGRCEEALVFYADCLGGGVGFLELHRFAGSPMAANASNGWEQKIMHASLGSEGKPLLLASDGMPDMPSESPQGFSLAYGAPSVEEAERVFIEKVLARHNGDVRLAAEQLGMSRSALYRRLQQYGVRDAE